MKTKKGSSAPRREVAISEFKANCLFMLREVAKTKTPLVVTKFGKAIAEIIPPSPGQKESKWLGFMSGEIKFLGDVLAPVFDERDWKQRGK